MQTLKSLNILVTRPEPQATALGDLITQYNGIPYYFPTLHITPIPVDWSHVMPHHADSIIFTSAHAVYHSIPIHQQLTGKIIALGDGTAATLQHYNLPVDSICPPPFGTESLLTLPALQSITGQTLILIRGQDGRHLLANKLRDRGAHLIEIPCYQRLLPQPTPQQIHDLLSTPIDIVVSTSSNSMQNLFILVGKDGKTHMQTIPWLVISQRMAQAAKKYAINAQILVSKPSNDAIISTLIDWANNKNSPHGKY